MLGPIRRYTRWLHTQWPAGHVEKLPVVRADGSTAVPGLYVVGDLTGIPLLKFSADTGARAVQTIVSDAAFQSLRASTQAEDGVLDLAIVGGGVSGMAAALEARAAGLTFELLEGAEPFSTIVNFPKGKPIYTYPTLMTPAGALQFTALVKEPLVEELARQTAGITPRIARVEQVRRSGKLLQLTLAEGEPLRARRVIVAIGRSGNFRRLGVPGEALDKVSNRLHDPKDYHGTDALVVGGGDSALETAIALAQCGARVTLSYRKTELTRAKPDNVEALHALVADPAADVQISEPVSERITTSTGRWVKDDQARAMTRAKQAPAAGRLTLALGTQVARIEEAQVTLTGADGEQTLPNDVVFAMIGREAPLDFFRRSGVPIVGEWRPRAIAGLVAMLLFCIAMYHWKSYAPVKQYVAEHHLFPANIPDALLERVGAAADPRTLIGTLTLTSKDPAFYYSFAYCLAIVIFGIRRVRRRKTPYVARQTAVLATIQIIPLFLLPFVILPWLGHNGVFGTRQRVDVLTPSQRAKWTAEVAMLPAWSERTKALREGQLVDASRRLASAGALPRIPREVWGVPRIVKAEGTHAELTDAGLKPEDRWKRVAKLDLKRGFVRVIDFDRPERRWADALLPVVDYDLNGREYWRASGLILAWPLFVWNVFTGEPLWAWLAISLIQTFVLIPLLIWRYGKGAYCGWICSCGALAETMGDAHRHKMPHGPRWNRLNMLGQAFLLFAFVLLGLRVAGWAMGPESAASKAFVTLHLGLPLLNYNYLVDLWWAGIIGVALYFHFSGRVWCRFACPLAALMHIYARFSRFRIVAEKKKCISCNVCTSVCHQGIDVMNFANKGIGMNDPECVRCSACVQSCPTGVLQFGRVDAQGEVVALDRLQASPVRMREQTSGGAADGL